MRVNLVFCTGGDGSFVKCPTCQQEYNKMDAISNEFVSNVDSSVSGDKSAEETVKICTGCEESVPATSYCIECSEYLCDQCVQAHRRVKITKEHTIQPKDEVGKAEEPAFGEKVMYCPVHKNEPLKLYCDTCDRLTCRDCQLLEHKEHK